ncbi:MAG: ABC transporter substrate-binding protein [Ignisphaera sp.]|nr:ABC transporter substrate-binding protein [Ignisphaera sp.]
MQAKYIAAIAVALILGVIIGYLPPATAPKPTVTVTQLGTVTVYTTATVTQPVTLPTTVITTTTTPVITTITTPWPKTVIDALGREIRFDEPPKRIVSTIPSITEHLFVLGLGDRVVGVDKYSNWPSEVARLVEQGKIAVVGEPWTLDVEKVVALKPDLVLMCRGVKPQETQFAPKLEEMGVKTFFLRCDAAKDQYDIYADIRTISTIFGIEQKAEEVINSIQQKIDSITQRLTNVAKKPKVLHLVGPPSWGLYSTGGDTFIHWLITTAGGINIASQYSGWPRLSYEYILSQDPEIIIVAVHDVDPKRIFEEIVQTPLTNTTAWKTGRVYVLLDEADDMISRPGPRIADALTLIAKVIHPEVFGEVQRSDVVKLSSLTPVVQIAVAVKA